MRQSFAENEHKETVAMIRLGSNLMEAAQEAAKELQEERRNSGAFGYGGAHYKVYREWPTASESLGSRYYGPIEVKDKSMWHLFLLENGIGHE